MTAPGILVTRPEGQAGGLADELHRRGYRSILAPCLALVPRDGPPLALDQIGAIAVTSINGATALSRRTPRRDLPVFAVGQATASTLKAAGFTQIAVAGGDAKSLLGLLLERIDRQTGVLHVSGADIACDVAAVLTQQGFLARREILYAMEPVGHLPAPVIAALDQGDIAAVLLMSARTAAQFGRLIEASGRRQALPGIVALGLSPAVAAIAGRLPYRSVRASPEPTQQSLLELLEATIGRG